MGKESKYKIGDVVTVIRITDKDSFGSMKELNLLLYKSFVINDQIEFDIDYDMHLYFPDVDGAYYPYFEDELEYTCNVKLELLNEV